MPCDATIGIWGNGFFTAAIYETPPNTATGYTYRSTKWFNFRPIYDRIKIGGKKNNAIVHQEIINDISLSCQHRTSSI